MSQTVRPWSQTPPAVFGPVLGLFGLGLAWRRAAVVFGTPELAAELALAAVSLLFLLALTGYLSTLVTRPAALLDDLGTAAGRLGISGASGSLMLLAAVVAPYSGAFGRGILIAALGAHLLVATLSVRALMHLPLAQRRMSGAWHLTFVGFIIAPIAAVPLGWAGLALVIQVLSIAMAIAVWGGCALMLARAPVAPGLRPTLVIHLSPVSLFGIAAGLLGHATTALIFGWLSVALAAVLLARLRYLVADGFDHGWGAFTFPIAAFTNLMLLLSPVQGTPFRLIAALALIFTSVTILGIAVRIVVMWLNGTLAVHSGAARV